jgi:hypothetical protein
MSDLKVRKAGRLISQLPVGFYHNVFTLRNAISDLNKPNCRAVSPVGTVPAIGLPAELSLANPS